MTAWAGPYLAGCLLLLVAGGTKVREPAVTRRVLAGFVTRKVDVPSWAVQAVGLFEMLIGAVALFSASPAPAVLVAFLYLGFAGFVALSLASGDAGQGCGCFGEVGADVPLGLPHMVVDLTLASAALAVAAGGGLSAPAAGRVALIALAGVLAWVVYQVLVPLPRLMAGVRLFRR